MYSINKQLSSIPNWAKVTAFASVPAAAGFAVARFIDGYHSWLSLGPGGLPSNIKGFLINLILTVSIAQRDTKSLDVYNRPDKTAGWKESTADEKSKAKQSYLEGELPPRTGPESFAVHWVAPQRELKLGQYSDPKVKEAYLKAFRSIDDKHSDSVEWKMSMLERQGKAIFLKEDYQAPSIVSKTKREIGHLHESDSSGHVVLSIADANLVVAKGWGERHRLTGTVDPTGTFAIPLGYTMLYVPRNFEEVETYLKIFDAAIEYAKSNGRSP